MISFILKYKGLLITLALFIFFASILFVKSSTNSRVSVTYSHVQVGSIQTAFFASGILAYRNQSRLSSEIAAKVTHIYVEEGESVRTGQALIKLDDSYLQTEIAQTQAQVERSKIEVSRVERERENKFQDWQRYSQLNLQGMVSKQASEASRMLYDSTGFQLEAQKKSLLQDQAALKQREKMLEKLLIRSPIDGLVINIPIKVGETAIASALSMAGSDLLMIADPVSMIVEAHIAEHDIGRVKLGQNALITIRNAPNQIFKGRVVRIARSIQQDNNSKTVADKNIRTIPVQIELETAPANFIAGMSCELSLIEATQDKTLLIPLSAVQYEEANPLSSVETMLFGAKRAYFVWVQNEGKAVKKSIELGFADEHNQEVRRGLALGDKVVSGPAIFLKKVREGDALISDNH